MGTLPIIMIKGFRLKILPAEDDDYHHRFPILVFVIALMIGMQAPMMNCSGDVNLRRPYLFRDFEMLTGYGPQHSHPQHAPTMYQHQEKSAAPSAQYSAESVEDGSSEEGEDTQQYTAPLILDIDDPEMKARWMGLSDQDEQHSEEYDEDEEEQRSLSSTEFQSRSSQQIRSSSDEKASNNSGNKKLLSGSSAGPSAREDSNNRGLMDFSFNPFSYWQGETEDDTQSQHDTELPQSDETPEFAFYPYAYDANPSLDYYYDAGSLQQNDQRPIMPHLVPTQMMTQPKPKPKPKPVTTTQKPKKKKPKQKPKPKPKPKPMQPPSGGMMMAKPMKIRKKEPQYSQQFHYQEFEKPDKLSIISEKLSKLNPFRYVQIQKPQIKIQKTPGEHPPGMHQQPPPGPPGRPPKIMKKPKRPSNGSPQPPMRKPKPPSMIQTMMNKMKPKQPKPKQKPPKKPHGDESNPEFVMIFGEPFGDFSSSEIKGMEGQDDYRNEDDDGEEANDDDDEDNEDDGEEDEEDEEEDGDDDEDEEDLPQVTSITHGELPSGEMTAGEAVVSSDDGEVADDDDAETSQPVLVEDDEGDYEDGVIGLTSSGTSSISSSGGGTGAETRLEDADQKKKSAISFTKLIGWRKKKKRRRPHPHHKPGPARRPPNWKQYRPAPLLPDIGVSDAILKVVKNVGFLPEYDKTEKYGGHNKIKGKFTKTRPITFHSGLITQVLRRR